MTEKLKPCPFCGEKEQLHPKTFEYCSNFGVTEIHCLGCGARSGVKVNEENAIEAWNRRTQ